MNWNSKKFGLSMSNGWNDNFKTFLKKAQEENPNRENNRNSIYAENHPQQQGTRVVGLSRSRPAPDPLIGERVGKEPIHSSIQPLIFD